jgi:Cytochrome c oxidase subunit IV
MRVEAWIFGILSIFFAVVTPIYYFLSHEPAGTAALILTFFLVLMITLYFGLVARRIDPRPEDRKFGEVSEGAGDIGFFPPQSKWPLFVALNFVLVVLGPVFGWWLMILGFALGSLTLTGMVYEFYRGDHAH